MENVVIGLVAILVGALFCFRGNVAIRLVLTLWGAFTGFWLGAALAAALTETPMLSGPVGWIAAGAGALVAGSLAYFVFALAVVIGVGAVGFALGAWIATALGADAGVIPAVAGVVAAIALVALALITRLPFVLLVVLSATAGAGVIIAGVQVLLGLVTPEANSESVEALMAGQWWWSLLYLALAAAGMVVQFKGERIDARSQWRHAERGVRG